MALEVAKLELDNVHSSISIRHAHDEPGRHCWRVLLSSLVKLKYFPLAWNPIKIAIKFAAGRFCVIVDEQHKERDCNFDTLPPCNSLVYPPAWLDMR